MEQSHNSGSFSLEQKENLIHNNNNNNNNEIDIFWYQVDLNGKSYFWNRKTNETRWNVEPTEKIGRIPGPPVSSKCIICSNKSSEEGLDVCKKCFNQLNQQAPYSEICKQNPAIEGFNLCSNYYHQNSMQKIKFYDKNAPYFEFTNFAPFPIYIEGKKWPTVEHYFQAQKFQGTNFEEIVRHLETPRKAFEFSRANANYVRLDWNQIKDDVMKRALYEKFTQHEHLKQLLLNTGNAQLIEHTVNDKYWGDGGNGTGLNKLGEFLMEIREFLQKNPQMQSTLVN